MKRVLITLFVLLAALSVASITLAQSEPVQTPTENACYAGGAWDGKCDWPTEAEDNWAWTCGWYYARVIDGRIGAAQAPETCKFVAEQEPVDPNMCAPQDDEYLFSEGVGGVANAPVVNETTTFPLNYLIEAPGVLANDGNCAAVARFDVLEESSLDSMTVNADGSVEVTFTSAPAYVNFTYTTTEGKTGTASVTLVATIEPGVCEMTVFAAICVEGNTFTVTVGVNLLTSIGVLDTYADIETCRSAAESVAGTTNILLIFGELSVYGGAFTGDDRTYCAYRLGLG
jgi:hypothetical protein